MSATTPSGTLSAIVPCSDLDASEAFYNRLGFRRADANDAPKPWHGIYRILANGEGSYVHLRLAEGLWMMKGHNPFGLYFNVENVDRVATEFAAECIEENGAEDKPWGMYEFAMSDPDGTLVRIGWPSRLRG